MNETTTNETTTTTDESEPSIGRNPFLLGAQVFFRLPTNERGAGEWRPAFVVRVNPGNQPNLLVLHDGPNDGAVDTRGPSTSWRGTVPYGEEPGQWCWIPPSPAAPEVVS